MKKLVFGIIVMAVLALSSGAAYADPGTGGRMPENIPPPTAQY